MFRRLLPFFLSICTLLLGIIAYAVNVSFSSQGHGTLAQAPLNVSSQSSSSFIVLIDDSNSMGLETLFPPIGDLSLIYNSCTSSFFSSYNTFNTINNTPFYCASEILNYAQLFGQSGYNNVYGPARAIPPIDEFGFARSPDFNKTFFDPNVTYLPWLMSDGSTRWSNANPKAARMDPRNPSNYGSDGYLFTSDYNSVYDLTQLRKNANDMFSVVPSMTIPDLSSQGGAYLNNDDSGYGGFGGGWGGWGGNNNNSQWSSDEYTNNSYYEQLMAFQYFPATFYLLDSRPAPTGYKTSENNRPLIKDACGTGCNLRRYQIRPENYYDTSSYNLAIQNFANWFQYHRTRILSVVASLSDTLGGATSLRVGYFTIGNQQNVTMYQFPGDRPKLFDQFTRLQVGKVSHHGDGRYGGTPNRSAVEFMGKQFKRTDAGAPVTSACQKNMGMLFTDGYADIEKVNNGNEDGGLGPPFADVYSGTIADIATKYYSGSAVPLRTGAGFPAGQISVPDQCTTLSKSSVDWKRLDCETNLHMNFYAITLGAYGNIYGVNQVQTNDPYNNPPNWNAWSNPSTVKDPTGVDELWHATLDSRGRYTTAASTAELVSIMSQILFDVQSGSVPSGSTASSGNRIGEGSLFVTPFYAVKNNGSDWYGTLTAQTPTSTPTGITYTSLWEASARLPSASSRSLFVGTASGSAAFTSSVVTSFNQLCSDTANKMSLCTGNDISGLGISLDQAIAYLRGDQSLESSSTTPLRVRTTRLGDIINSTPVISSATDDYGYRSIFDQTTAQWDPFKYASYLTQKKSNIPVVYVGANDGILHAFNGNSGVEMFGFIPRSVVGHMGNLLFPYQSSNGNNQKFQHRYYVDGPIAISDAYWLGTWKTVLVATTGAGSKGAFALDISNPGRFTAQSKLWEIDQSHPNTQVANSIGNILSEPVIVPVKTRSGSVRWKAIFGNGYGSTNGIATLYVVDIASGAITLFPLSESVVSGLSNGLGNLVAIDHWSGEGLNTVGTDGYVDTVYAGDQFGAVWKIDLRGMADLASGVTAQSTITVPFFIATDSSGERQPILGGFDATPGPFNSIMIYFGTGSFSFSDDTSSSSSTQQSFYGVQDRGDGSSSALTRSSLQSQSVKSGSGNTRTVSSGTNSSSSSYGWYVDLVGPGERVVSNPQVANGIVYFTTYQLSSSSGCSSSGSNWLYGLDTTTGGGALSSVRQTMSSGNGDGNGSASSGFAANTGALSLSGSGTAPSKNISLLTTPSVPVSPNPKDPSNQNRCSLIIKAPGSPDLFMDRACGRQSWREVK